MFKTIVAAAAAALIAAAVAAPAHAGPGWFNGVSENGINLQGLRKNGLEVNGRTWQGLRKNGLDANSRSWQGVRKNGAAERGMDMDAAPAVVEIALPGGEIVVLR